MLLVYLLSQAASLQLTDAPLYKIHAHLTAADSLSAGAAESSKRAQEEHERLKALVASLHQELQAAQLAHDNLAKAAAAKQTLPPPRLLDMPLAPMAAEIAARKLPPALRAYIDAQVYPSSDFVTTVATAAGKAVGSAAASAAARHAADVAASALVGVACNFTGELSFHAAAAAAKAGANASWTTPQERQEASDLARGAAEDEVIKACMDDAVPVLESAKGNATEVGTVAGEDSSVIAAERAARITSLLFANRVADAEYGRVLQNYTGKIRDFSHQMALRAIANDNSTDPQLYASGTEEVKAKEDAIETVARAARKLVLGAEKVAAAAALKAAAPDIPERVSAAVKVHKVRIQKALDNVTTEALLEAAFDGPDLMNATAFLQQK